MATPPREPGHHIELEEIPLGDVAGASVEEPDTEPQHVDNPPTTAPTTTATSPTQSEPDHVPSSPATIQPINVNDDSSQAGLERWSASQVGAIDPTQSLGVCRSRSLAHTLVVAIQGSGLVAITADGRRII